MSFATGCVLVIGLRQLLGAGEQLAVALAQPHPFDGQQPGLSSAAVSSIAATATCAGVPTAMIISGCIDVAAEEPGPAAPTVCRAVDAEQHCNLRIPCRCKSSQMV